MAMALRKCREYVLRCSPDDHVRMKYGNYYLKCDRTHALPDILARHPDYRRNLVDAVLASKSEEPRVIDIGANIGDTAILLTRCVPDIQVLCIESYSRFLPYLKSNTGQISGVTIAEAFLSDRNSLLRGTYDEGRGTAHLVIGSNGETIPTRTLDELLSDFPDFQRPDLIKIVVDGFEPKILRGSKIVLVDAKPVVFYEWVPYLYRLAHEDNVSHAEFLMENGYDWFMVFTNIGELLLRARRPGAEILESLGSFSEARRGIDNLHFDVVAFPREKNDLCDCIWRKYNSGRRVA